MTKPRPRRRTADASAVGRVVMEHSPRWNLTTLIGLATITSMVGGLVVWVFGFLVTEKEFKDHVAHDVSIQSWNTYGFAANRLEYLDDKQAECDAKRMTSPKLSPADAAICARYEAKYKSKDQEAKDLKAKAMETTKEKP
jgi:hypothetical protein